MNALARVLVAKITLTVLAWCIPLLLFPTKWLGCLGFPVPEPEVFLRLLGMAYGALGVAYYFGLRSAREGVYPVGVVWTGIVSNGGAFAILALAAACGTWSEWGTLARVFMWGSLIGTGSITTGLIAFGPYRLLHQEPDGPQGGASTL